MTTYFSSMALVAAAVSISAATSAAAQPSAAKSDPGNATAKVPVVLYHSAFSGYRPSLEEKVGPWKEANDTVGRIGGWKAYAKEARQPEPKGDGSMPPPTGSAENTKP